MFAYELIAEFFEYFAISSPPGATRSTQNVDDIPHFGMGWICATQVCQKWRNVALSLKHLWANIVWSFTLPHAIHEIRKRAGSYPLRLDMDCFIMASRFRDSTVRMQSALSDPQLFLCAQAIVCTFSCHSPVPNAVHYFHQRGLDTSVWMSILNGNEFNHLTTLILPITQTLYAPDDPAGYSLATFKAPALQKLHLLAVRSRRFSPNISDQYMPNLEGHYAEAYIGTYHDNHLIEICHLPEFIAGSPALNDLVIQGPHFFWDSTKKLAETKPVHFPKLHSARVISTDGVGSFVLTGLIVTPKPWNLQTYIKTLHWPIVLPQSVGSSAHHYNDMIIDHSREITFISFTSHCHDKFYTKTRASPLDANFAASFTHLNLHVQPHSVTMAGYSFESFFEEAHRTFSSIVVGRLDELFHERSPAHDQRNPETWDFLRSVEEVNSIVLYGDQNIQSILASLPCPHHLYVHCAIKLNEDSASSSRIVIDQLTQSLKRWREHDGSLQYLTVTGLTEFVSMNELCNIFPHCDINAHGVEV